MTGALITKGSKAPAFESRTSHGKVLGSSALVELLPEVLCFVSDLESGPNKEVVAALDRRLPEFGRRRSQLLVVAPVSGDEAARHVDQNGWTLTVLSDPGGEIGKSFGHGEETQWVVVDEEGVVADSGTAALDPERFADQLVAAVDALPRSGDASGAPSAPRDAAPEGRSVKEVVGWATGDRSVEASGADTDERTVREEHGDVQR